MNITIEQEYQNFKQFQIMTQNITIGSPPSFEGWMQNKITLARYDSMKSKADPSCPHCHGNGYLPVSLPDDNIMVSCVCVDSGPRSTKALMIMQEINKTEPYQPPPSLRFIKAQTKWGKLINWLTQ